MLILTSSRRVRDRRTERERESMQCKENVKLLITLGFRKRKTLMREEREEMHVLP